MLLANNIVPVFAVCALDFDLSAAPDTTTIQIGESAASTITVTSLNGFAGTVTLTVLDYPEVTGTLNVPSVTLSPNGQETATLTVTHDSLSPSGDYSVTVLGAFDTLFHEVSVVVHVVGPDFSVAADPEFLTFSASGSGASTITVASLNSYSGTVDLLANAIPFPGLTTTFSADFVDLTPGSSDTVMLTIDSTGSTSPGVYIVYIEASDSFTSHFTSVYVTVTGPDFTMLADPAFLEISPGSFATSTITMQGLYAFAGTVDLAVVPPPPTGITAAPSPTSVPLTSGGTATSTLTIAIDPTITVPTFATIHVVGTSGSKIRNTAVFVIVPGPGISLAANPSLLSLDPGESGSSSITVTSLLGFAGPVDMTATSYDSCLGVSLSLPTVTVPSGGSAKSTLTINVDPNTPPAKYYVDVSGTGGTFIFDSVTLSVAVGGVDTTPPTWPAESQLTSSGVTQTTVTLSWTPATDDTGVDSYVILQDGIPIGEIIPGTATTHTITGLLPNTTHDFQVVAYDASDNSALGPTTTVTTAGPTNNPPVLDSIGDKAVNEGSLLTFTATANDPDGDSVSYTLQPVAPSGATITSAGVFTWTPNESQGPGTYSLTVTVSDGSLSDSETITVIVDEVNVAPVLNPIGDKFVSEGTDLSFTATASDSDFPAQVLSFAITAAAGNFPTGATMSPAGVFSWTPTAGQGPGTYTGRTTVSDGTLEDYEDITITVSEAPVNDPPVLDTIGDWTVNEGSTLTFAATATDPDGDSLSFSLGPGTPVGAAITNGGVFTWTPTEAQGPGQYSVTVIVSDGSLSDSETINVSVNEVNGAPVLNPIGDKVVQEGTTLSFTATATDPDLPAQILSFTMEPATTGTFPTGLTMSTAGAFSWTPTVAQGPGTYRARFIVSDGTLSDYEDVTFTVTETPANNPPVLANIGARQVSEGATLTITVTATDPDAAQTLSLSVTGLPQGATWASTPSSGTVTGTLTWTPSEAQGPGALTLTFTVSDGTASDSEDVNLTVSEVNSPPILQPIGDRSVQETTLLSLQATAIDPDLPSNTLSFSLGQGSPAGASITAGGAFSWTPSTAQGPGTYTITVIVSDGTVTDSETFTVSVTEPQRAPSAPTPFWQEPWFYAVIAAIALAGIGAAWKLTRGRGKAA